MSGYDFPAISKQRDDVQNASHLAHQQAHFAHLDVLRKRTRLRKARLLLAEILQNRQTINRIMTTDEKPTKEILENWHKDPNNWKWGWLYYNKDDKRIFPPKRNKYLGWTVNFANPISIVALVAVVAVIYTISKYLKSL